MCTPRKAYSVSALAAVRFDPVEGTLVLCVTYTRPTEETEACLEALELDGGAIVRVTGGANICRARSVAFDRALAVMQAEHDDVFDTVLCVDGDVTFAPKQARAAVLVSIEQRAPVAAPYVLRDGAWCCRPWREGRWLAGLGFLAVPRALLEQRAAELAPLGGIRPWCLTGEHPELPGEWTGEDFWFCLHWGGAVVLPSPVGHVKPVPLVPSLASWEAFDRHLGECPGR